MQEVKSLFSILNEFPDLNAVEFMNKYLKLLNTSMPFYSTLSRYILESMENEKRSINLKLNNHNYLMYDFKSDVFESI